MAETIAGGNEKGDEQRSLRKEMHRRPGAPTTGQEEEEVQTTFSQACRFFEAQGLDHMSAEDLALETCLRWLAQARRESPAGLSWLRIVQRNLLIDHLRWRGREQCLLDKYANNLRFTSLVGEKGAMRSAHDSMMELWVKLSGSDQEILTQHYMQGRPVQELAERFGVSPDCAKQRLCRARTRLARLCESIRSPLNLQFRRELRHS